MTTPSNVNLLQANKFQLTFKRLPSSVFFCQDVEIPGLSTSPVDKPTPFSSQFSPGDKLTYDPLNLSILVNEDMNSWKEIHTWMRAMAFPTEFTEYQNLQGLYENEGRGRFYQFSDAILTVLSSSNNPIVRFKFIEAFPMAMGALKMSTTLSPNDVLTVPVTIRYNYFNIEDV